MVNKKLLKAVEGKNHDRKPPYDRKALDRMGVPADMTAQDVMDLFSLRR